MVVVAVAGGTGNVGKTLVDALKNSREHEVIVLGRKVSSCIVPVCNHTRFGSYHSVQVPAERSAVPVFAVNYSDVAHLTKTLEENNVHTVISAMVMYDPSVAQAEVNLVAAAAKSSPTKRFVASNWGNASPEDE